MGYEIWINETILHHVAKYYLFTVVLNIFDNK